jgi:hypothetical protein
MDANLVTGLAGVLGSLSGASAAIATTWITQRNQTSRERAKREVYKRELLYSEFVTEVARLSADAVDHSLERPDTLANLFALLGRIRFVSSQPVVTAAEECSRHVVDLFNQPNATSADQLYETLCRISPDIMKTFSEACREELSRYSAR